MFLSELVKLRQRFKEHSITLLGASESVMRILRLVRFDSLFVIPD